MRLLILFVSILFLLQVPSEVFAQEGGWSIENFQSWIVIKPDGRVFVSETIEADFGTLQKHGIFRHVPFRYQLQNGETRYTQVEISSVTNNGSSIPYDSYTSGDFVEVTIGDPDKTISGTQYYKIDYFVSGVLNSFEDHDEFYWNVTGNKWEVPINQAKASVNLPEDEITRITCFEGATGSTSECSSSKINEKLTTFQSTRTLGTNEVLTIVVGYTKGLVPI